MNEGRPAVSSSPNSRRAFLKQSGVAVLAGTAHLALARSAHAGADDCIRIGLIGCGGRGTGAAAQALRADKNVKLTALGDVFPDPLQRSLALLKQQDDVRAKVDVTDERCFVGFGAYQQVIDSGVDLVLLATPPHFRPLHLQAAVDAGKHVFAEKPIAVDALGVKKAMAACEEAKRKQLSIVSGLCWRYNLAARAAIQQVFDGAIGEIVALDCSYNASMPGKAWPMVREPGWSDMEWQLRNWYWFTWLSGDHIVEQAIHSVDKTAWAVHDQPPLSAVGLGGLQCRKAAELGTIYDHHAITYEYPNGVKSFFTCRQQQGTAADVSSRVIGTMGTCQIDTGKIATRSGETKWRYRGPKNVMTQTEHDELFAALRAGQVINNGDYMCKSTLLTIMGRMASYTGQKVTWEIALNSQENLSPPAYEWGPAPKGSIAIPGVTPLV